ncbi:hypothetical protein EWM64_g1017 [Hericium alpestre]|uniref:DNA helicase n=1 Tax=Hericium alpestre TaxID=135208 RepID=A0A4Z0A8Y7_9AGAM|nr:hypothetical protein EWM64_g1017 [Hericium alpestre]
MPPRKGSLHKADRITGVGHADSSIQARIEAEKASWLRERQAQLDGILDHHDDLIREVFHLEKFRTLVSYDPKTAKEDNSDVYKEYKSNYDLISNVSPSAGPSRRTTRRAHNERIELLKGPVAGPSTPSPPTASRKPKNARSQQDSPIWGILSDAKGKGKEKDRPDGDFMTPETKGKRASKSGPRIQSANVPEPTSAPPSKARRTSSAYVDMPRDPPRKRRKTDMQPPLSTPAGPDTSPLPPPPSPVTPHLPRIRLVFRPPPPTYTNPIQKPVPARFDKSLTAALLDAQDVNVVALEDAVRKEARFREKVHTLRAQGRLQLRADLALSADREDVRSFRREMQSAKVAGTIVRGVKGYWENFAVKEGKARRDEEKRLRALAKETVKMVVNEWKKAVYHVREQERQRREAEEKKRGREHLDAILDQSGQILETQHFDLSRAGRSRSRSSSVSATIREWGEIDEKDEGDEEKDEDIVQEAGEELELEADLASSDNPDLTEDLSEEEEEGTSALALLGDARTATPDQTPRTSRTPISDVAMLDAFANEGVPTDDEPSMQVDDMFSPTSELVATPSSDHLLAQSTTAAFAETESQHSYSSSVSHGPSLDGVDIAFTRNIPRSYAEDDHTPLNDKDGIHTISVATSFKSHVTTESPADVADHSDFLQKTLITPVESTKSLPIFHERIFHQDRTAVDPSTGKVYQSPAPMSPTQPLTSALPFMTNGLDTHVVGIVASAASMDNVPPTPATETEEAPIEEEEEVEEVEEVSTIPAYLRPYAVAPVEWDPERRVTAPALLRGVLRPYQQAGLEWLASLHVSNLNGILADEMGLGKTIQTIALLAHLACDRGIWGPHLIIVPTSVLLNWEMEFKKFLPGFKVLAYHGTTIRRKELRKGWNDKFHFNVCITSYTLASRDAHIFKRKPWYYMILDEAHMIKNFKSQRWNILLMFRSFRRLLLTGTPLQNNLTELWALLQFLMSGTNFANVKEFGEWFANPLEKAVEMGTQLDDETQQRVSKLHQVLRPYLLRRLKRDVEKELPSKFEHLVLCPLSKRQRFLYDEFMSRAQTRDDLQSGVYQKIANILMQLRKVCNHPNLFEVRPIVTSFAMQRSAVADYEIKELLVRRQLLKEEDEERVNLDVLGLQFIGQQNTSLIAVMETRRLDGTSQLPFISELPGEPPPYDTRTIAGYRKFREYQQRAAILARWTHIGYLNRLRCNRQQPLYSSELLTILRQISRPLLPITAVDRSVGYLDTVHRVSAAVKSYETRAAEMAPLVDKFACITSAVVAQDIPHLALAGFEDALAESSSEVLDAVLHRASVKLQIAFPDPSLLQYDCGKLQELARLLRERKAGGHRVLIFTQMTRILDILEIFLNFHGYLYLRLDGATKIEDRQYITERFNSDPRVFCFIASSRSGGVGINLTGADTVIFYDSDFNPQMDRQCEDRAHRIGQIRDVHIYRFVSQHTVEEAMLRKANQKRSLDDLVIQKGEFDWRSLFGDEVEKVGGDGLTKALEEFEDTEDTLAARIAAKEEGELEGADQADFEEDGRTSS